MSVRVAPSSAITASAVAMIAFLAFLAGTWTAWRESFPFDPVLRRAFIGTTSIWTQYVASKEPFASDVWMRANGRESGVVTHVPGRAFEGYTLVTTGQRALLLEMDGTVVHQWSLPYHAIAATPIPGGPEIPDTWLYWRPARLFPNGDLIVLVDAWETTPVGLAMIKLDRQSRLIWAYHQHVHHDFDLDQAGNIYVLDQQIRHERPDGLWALQEPFLDESVVVLSPDGSELRRVSIMEAFERSEYREMVNRLAPVNVRRWGDYLHTNNVELVTPALARAFPFLAEGQVILSMRQLDAIAALDLDLERIVWAARGPWHRQHDPDLLETGRILLFDNQGDWARGGRSRVMEIDPQSGEIVWSYPSVDAGELWSAYRAEQQRLPNGNVLINEFLQGRLLEVTREGVVAWEFVSPFRHERSGEYIARLMFAERYPRDWIAFDSAAARLTDRAMHGGE